MDIHAPFKERKIRSTDDPWITDNIRSLIRRRKRVFSKQGRSQKWKEIKCKTDLMILERKKKYYEAECNKLQMPNAHQIAYRALNNIKEEEKPKIWSINSLRPKATDFEIVNELALYFSRIVNEYNAPLDMEDLPVTYDAPFVPLEPYKVAERIRITKKSKSMVHGDLIPGIVGQLSDILALPTTAIINTALSNYEWPDPWLEETQTIIPKTCLLYTSPSPRDS